ncbi:MAG: hypothetical protein QGH39_06700 [Candidatus Thermoplasmatota archaeon]|jgi:hypothetical protein|nr:hypothetical protein [Candidatus Thermoplasmatota archaeon]MDP7265232.1 hypothetical protein [Candidatus Thermoplasmatota archaeon]
MQGLLRLKRNLRAQSTLIDALLFFVILILASTFLNLSGIRGIEEVILRKDDMGYARDTLETLLKCSINMTNYTRYSNGSTMNVELVHRNVQELIAEDLMLRHNAGNVDLNSVERGFERPIKYILDNLTSYTFTNHSQVRAYHYRLNCEYGNEGFQILSGIPPVERYSSQRRIHMTDTGDIVNIILLIWTV